MNDIGKCKDCSVPLFGIQHTAGFCVDCLSKNTKTRQQAAKDGDKRYYTGKPCQVGHLGQRYTSNGVCVKCNAEAQSDYRDSIRCTMKKGNSE